MVIYVHELFAAVALYPFVSLWQSVNLKANLENTV